MIKNKRPRNINAAPIDKNPMENMQDMMPDNEGEWDENALLFQREVPLAMAYVPMQIWRNAYSEDEAFEKGTLFSDLDMPFFGGFRYV